MLIVAALMTLTAAPQVQMTEVPVVACASDGQVGPVDKPAKLPKAPRLPVSKAAQLAFYASKYGPDVLAPRGWHCFGLYGSDGSLLILTPTRHSPDELLAAEGRGIAGPAIVASFSDGGTSGRYPVIDAIARYFPAWRKFVEQAKADDLLIAPIPTGPYPDDIIVSRSKSSIRLVTPHGKTGAGTADRLSPGPLSIDVMYSVEGHSDEPSLLSVWVRLPPDQRDLALTIFDDLSPSSPSSQTGR